MGGLPEDVLSGNIGSVNEDVKRWHSEVVKRQKQKYFSGERTCVTRKNSQWPILINEFVICIGKRPEPGKKVFYVYSCGLIHGKLINSAFVWPSAFRSFVSIVVVGCLSSSECCVLNERGRRRVFYIDVCIYVYIRDGIHGQWLYCCCCGSLAGLIVYQRSSGHTCGVYGLGTYCRC